MWKKGWKTIWHLGGPSDLGALAKSVEICLDDLPCAVHRLTGFGIGGQRQGTGHSMYVGVLSALETGGRGVTKSQSGQTE